MKCIKLYYLVFIMFGLLQIDCKGQYADSEIRHAAVAGKFYPADSGKLRNALRYYLADAIKPRQDSAPLGLIAPHAGYIYSGRIAADAFSQVRECDYDVVVIMGPNHTTAGFSKISIWPKGAFETPLGKVPVDDVIASALLQDDADVVADLAPQETEHSIEVQLPFVQYLFPKAKIVPMVLGTIDVAECTRLGKSLAKILAGKKALIVASSDLSHYPAYEDAVTNDRLTLEAITTMDGEKISESMDNRIHSGIKALATCACGEGPILALVSAMKEMGCLHASIINYANSGDTFIGSGDRVVGYGAVAFTKSGKIGNEDFFKKELTTMEKSNELTTADKKALLKLARQTIEQYLTSETLPLQTDIPASYKVKRGAFVTLHKNKELRGCIGYMAEQMPLYTVIGKMALSAAFNDTRFSPLELNELSSVEVEISVLTPAEKIANLEEIVLGRDGVILEKGGRRAVYLPQVATETGWDKETFLTQLSYKAGLRADDWKTATLYTFRAEVFSESDFK